MNIELSACGGLGHTAKPPVVIPPVVKPKPTAPQNLGTSGITETEIELNWDDVANVVDYTVSVVPTVTGYPKTVTLSADKATGLTKDTSYTFSVTANNAEGSSPATTVTEKTATGTPPPPPADDELDMDGDGKPDDIIGTITEDEDSINIDLDGDDIADIVISKNKKKKNKKKKD